MPFFEAHRRLRAFQRGGGAVVRSVSWQRNWLARTISSAAVTVICALSGAVTEAKSAEPDTTISGYEICIHGILVERYRATGKTDINPDVWPTILDKFRIPEMLRGIRRERLGRPDVDDQLEDLKHFRARCRELQKRADLLQGAAWPRPYVVDFRIRYRMSASEASKSFSQADIALAGFSTDCPEDDILWDGWSNRMATTPGASTLSFGADSPNGVRAQINAHDSKGLDVLQAVVTGNGAIRVRFQIDAGLDDDRRAERIKVRMRESEKIPYEFSAATPTRVTLLGVFLEDGKGGSVELPARAKGHGR